MRRGQVGPLEVNAWPRRRREGSENGDFFGKIATGTATAYFVTALGGKGFGAYLKEPLNRWE